MRLNRMTDYGVVILCQMARGSQDAMVTAPYLAEVTHLPLPSVSKLLKLLTQKGILKAQRGASGGYGLARPAEAITASDIVFALEGPIELTDCIEGGDGGCERERSCSLRGHWNPVNLAIEQALSKVTLRQMATPRSPFDFIRGIDAMDGKPRINDGVRP
ncbi:SUF system Fe-S cluster assembly regulator [Telmatospirillum sp.]|uniref:SUF system Fe-S cluster assembly regulator n=1 Tax=Telmatospirillum sp. TaxID=2079197 RepID=UPI002845EC61|nr:SUF system Fe-S cluster assembly regulator [Telmatospirillum sp.]MDR3440471.1 SUF system Fe-S cluster assembly regulator [Telmatospirillum sp.]